MTSVSPVLTSVSPNINVVSPGMTPDLEDLGDNAVIENGQASAAFSGPYWPYAQHEHPVFTVMPHLANHIDRPCGWAGRNRYSDGNLTIAAPSQKGHDWQKNAIAIFQVHKEKFENASPVFAKMLNSDQCTFDPASKMYHIFLDENSKEVCYLLDAIYCEQREEPLSLRALDRHFIRDLWRTAAKCEMHMFATYASDMLIFQVDGIWADEALPLYKEAKALGFERLAQTAMRILMRRPLSRLPDYLVAGMTIDELVDFELQSGFEALAKRLLPSTEPLLNDLRVLFPKIELKVDGSKVEEAEKYGFEYF